MKYKNNDLLKIRKRIIVCSIYIYMQAIVKRAKRVNLCLDIILGKKRLISVCLANKRT